MSFEAGPVFGAARDRLVGGCSAMEDHLAALAEAEEAAVAGCVHEVRKLGKQLRGALTMAREAKPCVRWVTVIGRMLGEARDSTVRRETWARLGFPEAERGSIEWVIEALLDQESEVAVRRPAPEVIEWSRDALRQVRSRLEHAPEEELAERCVLGSRQMLRRLRRRLKRAVDDAEDRDFHEARKAVKAWLGGLRMLAPAHEVGLESELDALADLLGEEHDLEVLGEWLDARGFSPATAPRVWKRLPKLQIRARRRSLTMIRREVLPLLKAQVTRS